MIRISVLVALATLLSACNSGAGPKQYTVGGSVTGLSGSGLVLQNNSSVGLDMPASGPFTFAATLKNGDAYSVSVRTQPTSPWQTCAVSNGSGTVQKANVTDVAVACTTNNYQVGGTVTGLAGSGLTLQNNGAGNLGINASGGFQFASTVASGQNYVVSVLNQPTNPSQTCAVTHGSSTVQGANVTDVAVACTTNTYLVGGTVTGLAGGTLTLQNNGANNLAISGNGPFQFSVPVPSNGAYAATLISQPTSPKQTCVVTGASGTVTNSDVATINVTCVTNKFGLSGTVSGLSPSQFREPLVLSNGSDEVQVMANGSFTMADVTSGQPYDVGIKTQPQKPTLSCSVQRGSGTVGSADITDVAVTCAPIEATFVYATSYVQTLSVLSLAPDRSLQLVDAMPTGNTATSVTVDPSGQFVYLATQEAQGTIFAYAINPATGTLTAIGSGIVTAATPNHIITDPSGQFVFVANEHGGATSQGSVSVFRINQTGGLTEVPGSEFTVNQTVRAIGIDPSGRFLYTANTTGQTAGLAINRTTGALTALPGSPYPAGNVPFWIAVDPLGRFVYTMTGSAVDGVFGYAINPTSGVLTALPGSPFAVPSDNQIVVDPTGKFLYHLDRSQPSTSHIAGYVIDASGALTPMPGSPFADPNMPESGAFDRTGRFLYVTEEVGGGPTAGGVKVYAVDPDSGALSAVSTTPTQIATNPTSIAIR